MTANPGPPRSLLLRWFAVRQALPDGLCLLSGLALCVSLSSWRALSWPSLCLLLCLWFLVPCHHCHLSLGVLAVGICLMSWPVKPAQVGPGAPGCGGQSCNACLLYTSDAADE